MLKNKSINGDCVQELKFLDSNSIDLVIADPPYWKVVNEKWDRQWKTESEYIEWCLFWLNEISRVLRLGGSFYLFGYFRVLAHLIPHLKDLGLELRQQIIIDKGLRSVSGRATKKYKMFPNVTESILFIIKDNKQFIKPFLKERQKELGFTSRQINEKLGVKSNGGGMWSIYTGKNVCEQFPTKEIWNKLENVLEFNYPYEMISQTFNPKMGLTDVWTDIDFYEEKHLHPTQKPIKLLKRLIETSSNENDLVLDPFSGVGSTQIACIQTNRNYIGIELDKGYYNIGLQRIKEEHNKLF